MFHTEFVGSYVYDSSQYKISRASFND